MECFNLNFLCLLPNIKTEWHICRWMIAGKTFWPVWIHHSWVELSGPSCNVWFTTWRAAFETSRTTWQAAFETSRTHITRLARLSWIHPFWTMPFWFSKWMTGHICANISWVNLRVLGFLWKAFAWHLGVPYIKLKLCKEIKLNDAKRSPTQRKQNSITVNIWLYGKWPKLLNYTLVFKV